MRYVLLLATLTLILTGCAGYRGPGTYDGACYSCASDTNKSTYDMMMAPFPQTIRRVP